MKPRRLIETSKSRKGDYIMLAIPNAGSKLERSPSATRSTRQGLRYSRFLQADPLGYDNGMNLYEYVGDDPVNWTDPDGLAKNDIVITAPPKPQNPPEPLRSGTFGPASPGGGGNPGRGEDRGVAECPDEANCVIITAKRPGPSPFTRIVRSIGDVLDGGAERYLRPPAGRRNGENFEECVRRVAPEIDDLLAGGTAGILAGYGFKFLYPYKSPGSGTSVISILSRDIFGRRLMSKQRFGSISVGGAIGRVASKASVATGAAAVGLGVGKGVGAAQICQR